MVVQGGGRSWGGSASYRSSPLGIPASPAPRYGRPSAMVVTVRGDSVLHAERADRPGLLTVTDVAFTCEVLTVAERDADSYHQPRAEGAAKIGSSRTPMRPPLTVRDGAEGFL